MTVQRACGAAGRTWPLASLSLKQPPAHNALLWAAARWGARTRPSRVCRSLLGRAHLTNGAMPLKTRTTKATRKTRTTRTTRTMKQKKEVEEKSRRKKQKQRKRRAERKEDCPLSALTFLQHECQHIVMRRRRRRVKDGVTIIVTDPPVCASFDKKIDALHLAAGDGCRQQRRRAVVARGREVDVGAELQCAIDDDG